MFIAQELRKKSIAEYLLYMWQIEDLIRAYGCSLSRIKAEYISQFNYSDEQKEDMIDWYANLIRMLNQEGKRESGHLQINEVTLMAMNDLHNQLLQSTKFPFYTSEYYKVLPFIVELRNLHEPTVWHHDAALAKERNKPRNHKCCKRSNNIYRHAERLLSEG